MPFRQWHTTCIYKVDKFTFLFLRKAAGRNIEKLSDYIYFIYKILDQSKLKAFADNILNVASIVIFVFDLVENIERKGENAGTSVFSFSHNVFKRVFS